MAISVVIGTFGDDSWRELAKRALASVERQTVPPVSVHPVHAKSLQVARNLGAVEAKGEWLCFLDADDELDSGFIEAMEAKIALLPDGDFLLQPSNLNSDVGSPTLLPKRDIRTTNFLIIGTVVRRSQFIRLGGFSDLPVLEDWELWRRCMADGARHETVPDAVYKVTVRADGRNSNKRLAQRIARQIRSSRY